MSFTSRNNQAGFTLIELLISITIISVLSSIVLSTVNIARIKARDTVRRSDAHTLDIAIYSYLFDNDVYPPSSTEYGLDIANNDDSTPDFINSLVSFGYLSTGIRPPRGTTDISSQYWYINTENCNFITCRGYISVKQFACGLMPEAKAMLLIWYEGENPPNTGHSYGGGTAYCYF